MRAAGKASIVAASFLGVALAQQVVAPTPETVGSARGENAGGYNITNSFETGYRFAVIGGNRGKYRADENFLNGIRLLGSSFSANSRDGQGGLFDEILLNTQGLGNDPYEFVNLRIQKNRLYRYDMLWRLNDYFNPALTIAEGRHFRNTSLRWQDHDLVLLPQSAIQFRLGYSRYKEDGPALTTVQLFDSRGDEFTPFADINRVRNEFRLGNDIQFAGFKFSWLHAWNNFREDTTSQLGVDAGARVDVTSINSFHRVEPFHGNSPFWRGNLNGERKSWAINARITYVGAERDFVLDELVAGINRTPLNRQIVVTGNATRPTTAGDLSFSVFPSERLSIVNNTSFYSSRIDGNSIYRQVTDSLSDNDLVNFQFLGIRTITNTTDATYRVSPELSLYAGYHYSTRQIRSIENLTIPAFGEPTDSVKAEQKNHINSGLTGLRFKPIKPVTILLEGEVSRANQPFTPIADRNFHALRARAQYKAKSALVYASYLQNYNTNSVSLSAHSARSRNYTIDASWAAGSRFSLEGGYQKLHLDTVSGIAFFAGGVLNQGFNSIYISNIHAGNFGGRFAIGKGIDLYLGYSITKDTGDGRSAPAPPGTSDLLLPFVLSQTFPVTFQSPLARLSIRITPKLRWNAGWQFFNYDEKFQLFVAPQGYRANTGYTSLLWSF